VTRSADALEPARLEQLEHARREDDEWFEHHSDREYRCRRCWPCEFNHEPPVGFAVFAVVHRFFVDYPEIQMFGAPLMFDPGREDDVGCRLILRNLAINPRSYLRG
jgi:hypothetical protein